MFNRKRERPHYKKNRQFRGSGWEHLCCQTCSEFDRGIKFSKSEEEKQLKTLGKKHHVDLAVNARNEYYRTRNKAQDNKLLNDVSMIIDAGGGAGCIHIPRFPTTEKGEPARHEMLKIKSTFVKVISIITESTYM